MRKRSSIRPTALAERCVRVWACVGVVVGVRVCVFVCVFWCVCVCVCVCVYTSKFFIKVGVVCVSSRGAGADMDVKAVQTAI